MDKEQILKQFGYFKDISDLSRKKIADICLAKMVEKKETIFVEGEKAFAVYCCINGRIQLHKTTPDGREVVIKVIKPGEMFGEVILFESPVYPVTAIALTRSQVFLMPKHQFHCLLEQQDFRNDFISVIMRKQMYLANQIKYLVSHDVEDRLLLFLRENYGEQNEIKPAISKKDVAAAIGTTPETLSRVLLRMKKEGTLYWEDKLVTISADAWMAIKKKGAVQ